MCCCVAVVEGVAERSSCGGPGGVGVA
jgi:hypothetical protein